MIPKFIKNVNGFLNGFMLFQVKLHKTKSLFKEQSSLIINKLDGFDDKWFHVVLESFIPCELRPKSCLLTSQKYWRLTF